MQAVSTVRAFSPPCGRGSPHMIDEKTPSLSLAAYCSSGLRLSPLFGFCSVRIRSWFGQ